MLYDGYSQYELNIQHAFKTFYCHIGKKNVLQCRSKRRPVFAILNDKAHPLKTV